MIYVALLFLLIILISEFSTMSFFDLGIKYHNVSLLLWKTHFRYPTSDHRTRVKNHHNAFWCIRLVWNIKEGKSNFWNCLFLIILFISGTVFIELGFQNFNSLFEEIKSGIRIQIMKQRWEVSTKIPFFVYNLFATSKEANPPL